ncbi:MAG: type 1 glutamine amidotransferase domain-containing protein [Candidatus Limnocylindria bacterium]
MDELRGRTVAILVEKLYEDLELWYPLYRLREAGARTILVGPSGGETYASKHGYPARAERASGDVAAAEVDGVIIPGGYAPDHMRRDPEMVRLVREADAAGKVVAAICHAGWMLVSAGIARDRRLTCFHSIRDDLVAAGALFEDREVVRDGNLITSRRPDDLPAFCRTIIAALSETGIVAREELVVAT